MKEEKIVGYHFRAEKISVGKDIPHTTVRDNEIPPDLWTTPLVWFVTDKSEFYNPHDADPVFVHEIEVNKEDIIRDKFSSWGATKAPAIVKNVRQMRNPLFRE